MASKFSFVCLIPFSVVTAACACPPPVANDGLYEGYDRLLRELVDDQGMVDYPALVERKAELEAAVASFAEVDSVGLKGAQQTAFWINAYNAVTLQQIVTHYPLDSINELAPKSEGGFHVWESPTFQGKSLNQIEHEILRPLGDPRIHSAIVCASKGCPPLRPEAYLPSKLEAQLDDNTRVWLASPTRGIRLAGKTLYLSRVFEWFGGDFAPNQAGHLRWVRPFLGDEARAALEQEGLRVEWLEWNWALNAQ